MCIPASSLQRAILRISMIKQDYLDYDLKINKMIILEYKLPGEHGPNVHIQFLEDNMPVMEIQ